MTTRTLTMVSDRIPLIVAALGLALVVIFDLGTANPFNDEWAYSWVVQRFADGHGFHLFPGQAPTALVQLVLGLVVSIRGVDPHVLRLTAVPFIVATAYGLYRLSRDLGADRFFSGVAAAAPLAIPVYAASVTSFMTEPYYLGLLVLAALSGTRWLATGRGSLLTMALCCLAALQRQHAAALPPALTIGLLLASRRRPVRRAEWAWLGAAWVLVAAALALPEVLGLQTAQMRDNFISLSHPQLAPAVASVLYLPGMLGLGTLAFGGGLLWRSGPDQPPVLRSWRAPALLGLVVVLLITTYVLPGNYLTPAGLNPITVAGAKPDLYGWVLPVVKGLSLLGFVLLAARPAQRWLDLAEPRVAFLAVLGTLALVPLLDGDVFDRYYLPVVLPWIPLAAALTREARWPAAARTWATVALVAGIVVFAAGEQDYQAWQVARAEAERQATQRVPAAQIFSGFETYAVEVILPAYERTGRLPQYADRHTTSLEAPRHARLALLIEPPGDPRPGVSYISLSPGKIVTVCIDAAGCP